VFAPDSHFWASTENRDLYCPEVIMQGIAGTDIPAEDE